MKIMFQATHCTLIVSVHSCVPPLFKCMWRQSCLGTIMYGHKRGGTTNFNIEPSINIVVN